MCAVADKESILLLGGFDHDNFYNSIYQIRFEENVNGSINYDNINGMINNGEKDKDKLSPNKKKTNNVASSSINFGNKNCLFLYESNSTLPNNTFFNSNFLNIKNELVLIDGFNNALEVNQKTLEVYYYT